MAGGLLYFQGYAQFQNVPGDFLSTSRFIRALIFSRNVPTNLSSAEQVGTAFHLLGQFDLPPGSQGIPVGGGS